MDTTFTRLQSILVADYNCKPESLTPTTTLEELAIDSLGMIELFYKLEDEYKISVETEPTDLKTLDDVVRYIDGLIEQQRSQQPAGSPQ